ncbi:MAG: ABC transporter ATP-binding protein [Acidimicrobiales bacterium]|nr:ABC transporter ATP-binding protein [Acidimicrobiales bacterium]
MRVSRLLLGPSNEDIFATIQRSPYVPLAEKPQYRPPKHRISSNKDASWVARMWPLVKAHGGVWSLALIGSFVALLTQIQIPKEIGSALGQGLSPHSGSWSVLTHFAVIIGVMIVVREVSNYVGRRGLLTSAYSFEFDLRNVIYEHYMRLSHRFYDRAQVGQLISRANSDVRAVQQYLVMAPTVLVQCAVVILAFVEMFLINVPLTLVTMASIPLTLLFGIIMRKRIFPVSWLIQARLADVGTIVEENVSGVRIVKSFAAEQNELSSLAGAADRLQWGYVKDADIRGTWAPMVENLPRAGLAVILLYGGILALNGGLGTVGHAVGLLFTFQSYMLLFQPPFRQLGMVIMTGQRASASAQRILEIMDTEPDIVNHPGAVDLTECHGHVEFRDVTFAYGEGPPVLSHFDLDVWPGETIALVGRTGSGKSTVARLINRSYDVTEGELLVDGDDVRNLTLESLRAHVGIVLDEPFLFSVSIRDNIAYGRPDATPEEVEKAARAAEAHGFIEELPEGYETVVGERGYTLSGGQRQRIALARTLLVNPPVLILDDATSAIDVQVEQRIIAALRELMTTRTTIIIAHRLATISLADRVVLIEDGRVVASGRHEELLETNPRYVELLARAVREDGEEPELVDGRPGALRIAGGDS